MTKPSIILYYIIILNIDRLSEKRIQIVKYSRDGVFMDKETIKLIGDMLDERLDKKLAPIMAKLDEHSAKLDEHSTKLDEHTQILRALEHLAQVNKVEHDQMSNDIAHMKGDVESVKKGLAGVELITANNWSDLVKIESLIQ